MWDEVSLPRAARESAASIAAPQGSSLLAGGVSRSAAEVEGPTVPVTQPHLRRRLAEQPQNCGAADLTTALDDGTGSAGEPRSLGDRLAASRMGCRRRVRSSLCFCLSTGNMLLGRRSALLLGCRSALLPCLRSASLLRRRSALLLRLFEHRGFGMDHDLVDLRLVRRRWLAQEALGHEHERIGLSTLNRIVTRQLLRQAQLFGGLDRTSVVIEHLSARGSERGVEHSCIFRWQPQYKHDGAVIIHSAPHRSTHAL